ncbi:MAG: carboxypeptidase regulatory-like domain-containing protein [Acidobacteriota bacterium]
MNIFHSASRLLPNRPHIPELCRRKSPPSHFPTFPARLLALALLLSLAAMPAFAKVTGTISGTVRDPQGAVIPGTTVQLTNTQTGVVQTMETDEAGFYNFAAVDVGTYSISFTKSGFSEFRETNLIVNVDTSLSVDANLQVGSSQEQVTVTSSSARVDTETSQIGEVIGAKEMTDLPLNGRAFTDLLALQPGVVPISTSQYGTLLPSNYQNNGLLSMGGARDVNSGFMVNGANVVEGFGAGTTVVPNLDSIGEFRIITSNAGAEYGNYAGGQVNVVTKSGTNDWHGDVFEFLRNTDLDAKNFFSSGRGVFHQNQFGGTFGGPILRNKAFFFVDYQGTRQNIGQPTGNVSVPSSAERTGDYSNAQSLLAGGCQDDNGNPIPCTVNGSYWAGILSNRLGYAVSAGEPYYATGCTSASDCVFPNAIVPHAAWDPVSSHIVSLIPAPNTGIYFNTSAYPETLQDDKGGLRADVNTRIGRVSAYYFDDPWNNVSPYDTSDGANLPGFPDTSIGSAKLATLGVTTTIGANAVNVFTASWFRNKNLSGETISGPSLASLGFAAPQDGGIFQLTTQYQNYPTVLFNAYSVGPPESRLNQLNNTYQFQDDFSKVIGNHTVKFGADYHWDLIGFSRANMKLYFEFYGGETGIDFVDMLLGAPDGYFQATPASVDLRNFYTGAYGEDSWRLTRNLTFNYGLRWDVDPYWAAAKNNEPVLIAGKQSATFPTAPVGYNFPGDPGIPKHMANIRWNDFGPRIGLAWSPEASSGFLHTLLGDHNKSSIRVGYGLYYTNIEGSSVYTFSAAPYGYHYTAPDPPLLSAPFISRSDGTNNGQRFPLPPATSNATINWKEFEPISGIRNPLVDSPSPYTEHVDLSFQRQLATNTVWTISYVGTFGHHLILNADNNPGNQALCLALSDPGAVMPGTDTCGPNLENHTFYPLSGNPVYGTRAPFGQLFKGNGLQLDIGNSSYHGLETTLRQNASRASFLLSYTWSKALDEGSGFGEQVVLRPNGTIYAPRALSLYDLPQNLSLSYTFELPFDLIFRKNNQLTRGWKISGISEFTSGLPVTMYEMDDNSLLGSTNNSGYFGSPDLPTYTPGKIYQDKNPRDNQLKGGAQGLPQYAWFNIGLFSPEPLGQIGNSSRRFFFGPGTDNWDMSLLKDFRIGESKSFEFRAEFFNVFNHAQFQGAFSTDGNLTDLQNGPGNFGFVNGAADPRIGQMALKFLF